MSATETLHASEPGDLRPGIAQIGSGTDNENGCGTVQVTVIEQLMSDLHAGPSVPIEAWLISEDSSETYGDLVAAFPHSGLWPIRDLDEAYLGTRPLTSPGETAEPIRPLDEFSPYYREPAETIRQAFGLDRREDWDIQEEDFCFDCGPVHDATGELAIESEVPDSELLARALDDPGRSVRRGGDVYWRRSSHAPIVLVPVRRPSDFPVVARWNGAANADRESAEQQIILRSWEERFGAYTYSAGISTMELVVARPPATIEQARMLARELLHFCPYDTQHHGLGGIENYARNLIGANWWSFWWD